MKRPRLAEDFRARAVARAIDVRRESLLSDFPMTALCNADLKTLGGSPLTEFIEIGWNI